MRRKQQRLLHQQERGQAPRLLLQHVHPSIPARTAVLPAEATHLPPAPDHPLHTADIPAAPVEAAIRDIQGTAVPKVTAANPMEAAVKDV